ncbi:hypothetical protein GLOTRDRAFT_96872 [Gloeophyllum trabeum ATCC 11539]|uniref:Uncharacterized protein n=1 Tax=Gloeophyllum trabeum (strain ATCC 11539 / FP-39264 / Madison 617) TaxID=670483 RepID=S7PS14_GLOTA|nr:uncharacterized protein GLOTRDRAFT_96872 [Gloeophyllum trabeum ATCC 11539]EPQ50601.1 hypothetical protein GLOTRDRAFT_96872 [Gloeophyllum trabeum ATCC 11539]
MSQTKAISELKGHPDLEGRLQLHAACESGTVTDDHFHKFLSGSSNASTKASDPKAIAEVDWATLIAIPKVEELGKAFNGKIPGPDSVKGLFSNGILYYRNPSIIDGDCTIWVQPYDELFTVDFYTKDDVLAVAIVANSPQASMSTQSIQLPSSTWVASDAVTDGVSISRQSLIGVELNFGKGVSCHARWALGRGRMPPWSSRSRIRSLQDKNGEPDQTLSESAMIPRPLC